MFELCEIVNYTFETRLSVVNWDTTWCICE